MSPAKRSSRSSSGASPSSKRTSKKTTAKKTSKKKTTARKTAVKKTATGSKPTQNKSAGQAAPKKTAAKKTAKKTAAKKATTKKTTPKKTAKKTSKATPRVRATRAQASRPAPAKKTTRTAKPAKFDDKQLGEIRQRLVEERTALQRQLAELEEESFESTQSDITGEVGIDEDFADAGSATFDRERALSIHNNIVDLIDQMTRAMSRIDDGTYGSCERCGRPIDAARLKALPHALLCMDCKRREERAR